jgi:hypothetical protein
VRVASVVLFLAACAGKAASGGGPTTGMEEGAVFKVFYPDQPIDGYHAKVGKKFIVKPVATCTYENGRDARWSMTGAKATGELPEGFTLEEGVVAGTPKAPGSWTIEVKFNGVTCAGKQSEPILVKVMITAK